MANKSLLVTVGIVHLQGNKKDSCISMNHQISTINLLPYTDLSIDRQLVNSWKKASNFICMGIINDTFCPIQTYVISISTKMNNSVILRKVNCVFLANRTIAVENKRDRY